MLILKNGMIMTMVGDEFVGDIAVEGGSIKAIGQNLAFDGAEVRDVSGRFVMPGIIDAHSHIGLCEDTIGWAGEDSNEATNPLTPEIRAIDAINPYDRVFEEARAGGVTTCVTGPGSANVIGGLFVAIKTYGRDVEGMILRDPIALKAAFGENPKRSYGQKQSKTPATRMATAAILRKALIGAEEYGRKMEAAGDDAAKRPERDLGKETILKVLRRELPLKIHAHRADDIMTAIRIADEFNIRYTLDHCTEGYLIPDQLKDALKRNCEGLIIGPLLFERPKAEMKNLSYTAPRILDESGITFAMMTDCPDLPERYLNVYAAIATRDGLPDDVALRAITINAARATKIDDRVGSLEIGKDADIAVFDRHPLDVKARCKLTLVNGAVAYEEA